MGIFLTPNEKGDYLFGGDGPPGQDPANIAKDILSQQLDPAEGCAEPSFLQQLVSSSKALKYKCIIEKDADKWGIPWQILGGLVESEIQLDTPFYDSIQDALYRLVPAITNYPIPVIVGQNPGPGIGNIHILTAKATAAYFRSGYVCFQCESFRPNIQSDESNSSISSKLLNDEFSINFMAAEARHLADYRFGSNGQPWIGWKGDLAQWTLTDAVAIWHGYRYGVRKVTPLGDGFRSIEQFQERSLSLDEFIDQNVVGQKGNPKQSARDSIQYFQAYWNMAR